jgi:hypothetical protein
LPDAQRAKELVAEGPTIVGVKVLDVAECRQLIGRVGLEGAIPQGQDLIQQLLPEFVPSVRGVLGTGLF